MPIERMIAMSRAFSMTMVEMTLKMPKPATTRIDAVVRNMILSCSANTSRTRA